MAISSQAESLTRQFYRWEQRGRGWNVWDDPVEIEPPFVPFFFSSYRGRSDIIDDGRKPTFLSSLFDSLRETSSPGDEHDGAVADEFPDDIQPTPLADVPPVCELTVSPLQDGRVTSEQLDQYLLSLSSCDFPVTFEVLGTIQQISLQVACHKPDLLHVESSLKAYFPGLVVARAEHTLDKIKGRNTLVVDFGLSEEFMRPLRTFQHFDPDPLTGIVTALENLKPGESGLLQVMFQTTRWAWTDSILRSVSDGEGGSFFEDSPEMLPLAREKTKRPLFACVIRAMGSGSTDDAAWDIVRRIAGGLPPATSHPQSNELIPLTNDGYDDGLHIEDVIQRQSRRTGMLLNSHELASLVHPLSGSIVSEKLPRYTRKTRSAPALGEEKYVLGENVHQGVKSVVGLSTRQRLSHMHIIGATGTGKSTLLLNLIAQDIEQGTGCAVIDPHGDLIEKILGYVPRKRMNDVVLFDPSDPKNPHGINILSAKDEAEKNVAASDLVAVFRRMSTSWGDQMTVVLGNAIQAFLESHRSGTLIDLRRFLLDNTFRKEFLKSVRDKEVRFFWEQEHQMLRGGTIGSLLTRLDTFLRPKVIRRVVAPSNDLQVGEIMNRRGILLVKLAQGLIGEENSTLLGTMIVSKLHQAAMARQSLAPEKRSPFFLYIDEFQNFITPSLAGVLSGTRKYGLGLVLAHQEMRQIYNQDTGVANSVMSNPGTRVCFRLGDFDAQKLQDGLAHFTAADLQNLGIGEAICRVERADDDFNMKVIPRPVVNQETAKQRRKRLIELSHVGGQTSTTETPLENEEPEVQVEEVPTAPPSSPKPPHEAAAPRLRKQPAFTPLSIEPEQAKEDTTLSQHRYLQTLIKRMAEDRGYRAVIEEPTPDGQGRVDVGLERDGERIACEISVTTTDEHELHNIEKCLAAGYGKVIVCTAEKKQLEKIRALTVKKLPSYDQAKVLFFEPQEVFSFLEKVAVPPAKETRVKGYRVKVEYQDVEESERKNKRDTVAQVILQSMRRMKGK